MRKVYSFLRRHFIWAVVAGVACFALGMLAFALDYKKTTSRFSFPGIGSAIFLLVLAATAGYVIYFACHTKKLHITKIRKQSSNFLKLSTWLAAAMALVLFIYETSNIVTFAQYGEGLLQENFTFVRSTRYVLTLLLSAYFCVAALPAKFRRKKIVIPKPIKYILSISTVLWGIFGLLSVYFYEGLSFTNVLKLWQVLMYLVFIFFFLAEAQFEHIKPNGFIYICAALAAFTMSMAFNVSTIFALSTRLVDDMNSFSEIELVTSFSIALYALSRVHAIQRTMKHVMDNSDKHSFSSKFKRKPDDFATPEEETV